MSKMKEVIAPDVLHVSLSGAGNLDGYNGSVYKEELVLSLCDKIDSFVKQLEVAEKANRFTNWVIDTSINEGMDIDGFDIQEKAVEFGLLYETTATKEDVTDDSEFEVGDIIYKPTEALDEIEKLKE